MLKWATGQHATAKEKALYGAALKIFVDSFATSVTPKQLLEAIRPNGVEWVRERIKVSPV